MLHSHKWVETARTFAEPNEKITPNHYNDTTAPLVHGLTTIIWECSLCGTIRKETMLGKEIKKD